MYGDENRLRLLILTEHKGAPDRSDCLRKTEGGFVYVSPKYKRWLVQHDLLLPLELAAPLAQKHWQSANSLKKQYVGNSNAINEKLTLFREEIILCLQAAGENHEAAEKWVEEKAIGTYREEKNGKTTLFASPWIVGAMEKEDLLVSHTKRMKDVPLAPEGWQSAGDLRKAGYDGKEKTIKRKFIAFSTGTMTNLESQGEDHDAVKKWVQEAVIGTYRKTNNAQPTLFASPQTVERMRIDGELILKKDAAPSAPDEWFTASAIKASKIYKGSNTDIIKKLWGKDKNKPQKESISEKLVGDIVSSLGITDKEALQFIDDHLGGMRKRKNHPEKFYFSMDLARAAVTDGILERHDGKQDVPDDEIRNLLHARKKAKFHTKETNSKA